MKNYKKYTDKQLLVKATKLQFKMAKLAHKEAMNTPDDISAAKILAKTAFQKPVEAKMSKTHAAVQAILAELSLRANPEIKKGVHDIVKAMEKEAKKRFKDARGD